MRAVHFGAGNIGRGFIGIVLANAGYEITFVARNEKKVSMLQEQGKYKVILANKNSDTAIVRNVTAINRNNDRKIAEEVARADLVTTAVGINSLQNIAEPIAEGIELRLRHNPRPLHIIACENAIGGSSLLKKWVYPLLQDSTVEQAEKLIAFPDAAVDRIVPAQQHEHPLNITVEPFCEWIVDHSAIINGFKGIKGVQFVDRLDPYIERKLFTVNAGHAAAAYLGYLAGKKTIQEVMQEPALKLKVEETLQETGQLLVAKYGWNETEHAEYVNKTIERFANPNLSDKVIRVGRCPARKLSPDERLVRPAMEAASRGLKTDRLAEMIAAALLFDYAKDPQVPRLQAALRDIGLSSLIAKLTGIPAGHPLHHLVIKEYERLQCSRILNPPLP